MKKILCILLCATVLFGTLSFGSTAFALECNETITLDPKTNNFSNKIEKLVSIESEGDEYLFEFSTSFMTNAVIESTGDYDTIINLYDSSKNPITYDDNSGEGQNFLLNYSFNQNEVYYFGVSLTDASKTGEFYVSFYSIETYSLFDNKNIDEKTILSFNSETSPSGWLEFAPELSADYTLTSLGNYDTMVTLYEVDEYNNLVEISNDDDSGENRNFKISGYFNNTSRYFFHINFYYTTPPGDLEILLTCQTEAILVGETKNVATTKMGETIKYRFTPKISGQYNISSKRVSTTVDPIVTLYDAKMNKLASDDDSLDNRDFSLSYNFIAGKTYIFAIGGANNTVGEFPATLTAEFNREEINYDETKQANITSPGFNHYFIFKPSEDMECVFASSGNFDTKVTVYDSNMTELASDDDSGEDKNFSLTYNFESGQEYILSAYLYSNEKVGNFDVSLTRTTPHIHTFGEWCYNSDAAYTSSTEYKNGTATRVCTECGENETKEIEGTGLLRARAASCEFASEIRIMIAVKQDQVNQFKTIYCKYTREDGKSVSVPLEKSTISEETKNVFFPFSITPQSLNSNVKVQFFAVTNDDITVWGEEYTYNMAQNYITKQIEKTTDTNWKRLLVELVYYGYENQVESGWALDNPLTDLLSEEDKSLHQTGDLGLKKYLNTSFVKAENPLTTWRSINVEFGASTKLIVRTNALELTPDLRAIVEVEGEQKPYEYQFGNPNDAQYFKSDSENGIYFTFPDLAAKRLRSKVYITLYKGDEQIINTLEYSVETYCLSKLQKDPEETLQLTKMTNQLMRYANAARAYFGI